MKWLHALLLSLAIALLPDSICEAASKEEECEREEKDVELCARDFLIYRNGPLPQSGPELDKFCRENKAKESCLSAHSKKCLSHSANQAITELIRSMSKQNRAICSSKSSRGLYAKASQCINKQSSSQCYQQFVDSIHGIHQFSQEDKIPVICCSYVAFASCVQTQVKSCGMGSNLVNATSRMVKNYAGETLSFVCREYKAAGKCGTGSKPTADPSQIHEEIPQSFFSLLVKIYLS